MAKQSKPRIVKDFDKLPKELQAQIKADYPNGFSHKLISYTTPKGEKVMALPFDTDDLSYLVRVTVLESRKIVGDDDDLEDDATKPIRDDLDLEGLDIDGLKEEEEPSVADDDDDEDFVPSRRRRKSEEEDDGDDDY